MIVGRFATRNKGFNPAPSRGYPVYRILRLEVCPSGGGPSKSLIRVAPRLYPFLLAARRLMSGMEILGLRGKELDVQVTAHSSATTHFTHV